MTRARLALSFLLVPGTIIFALPLWQSIRAVPNAHPFRPLRVLAALCWVLGGSLARSGARAFFTIGQGSPSPADPPKVLVTTGPFRYTRNPLYLGGLVVLLGHLLFFQSRALLVYIPLTFLLFHAVVVFREEPYLRGRFGDAYAAYCRDVPRWLGSRATDVERS